MSKESQLKAQMRSEHIKIEILEGQQNSSSSSQYHIQRALNPEKTEEAEKIITNGQGVAGLLYNLNGRQDINDKCWTIYHLVSQASLLLISSPNLDDRSYKIVTYQANGQWKVSLQQVHNHALKNIQPQTAISPDKLPFVFGLLDSGIF